METGYSTRRAAEIAGLSYRQMDYWDRTGVVHPSLGSARGSGSRRRYSWMDVAKLMAASELRDAGMSLERVRRAMAALEDLGEVPPYLWVQGGLVGAGGWDDLVRVLERGRVTTVVPIYATTEDASTRAVA